MKKNENTLFYIHPWEFDIDQPKVIKASIARKFRHYLNLNKTKFKIENLINDFNNCNFITCKQYIEIQMGN